jgi:hypothetical protein
MSFRTPIRHAIITQLPPRMMTLMIARFVVTGMLLAGYSIVASAKASGPFSTLAGAWSGSGQARLDGGRTETMKCKAYYTDKNAGAGLGISLRCAGAASSSIDLRATLAASSGRVSGNWEERQFNAGGSVAGQVNGNRISVAISGGGLSGSMTVTTNGASQSVQITAEGVAFKGMSISMSRAD